MEKALKFEFKKFMRSSNNIKKWFTLVEVLISITIFSIMIVAVISTFILSGDLSNKTDINRVMQENIKNITENIAEDIRKNGFTWVWEDSSTCDLPSGGTDKYWSGQVLCTGTGATSSVYYLAKYDNSNDSRIIVSDPSSEAIWCTKIWDNCTLVVNKDNEISPLSNSWVQFKYINFYVSTEYQPKVTINFSILPSGTKWIKPDLIKSSEIIFQTTLSKRLYDDY